MSEPILLSVADDIWIYDGSVVSFYAMPYTTRMTVVRLPGRKLWIHSPEKITPDLLHELNKLGQVAFLISPNKIHHLFLSQWIEHFPKARLYAAPGLETKRKDIGFDKVLTDTAEEEWSPEIDQLVFRGSRAMEEVVFFHRSSRTLILTDLIENFSPDHFHGVRYWLALMTGIISPNGKTPIDWRMTFSFGKKQARQCLAVMRAWQAENIILSHGECIFGSGDAFLAKSFRWLQPT